MSVDTVLGKVSVVPKGAWSSSNAYEVLDIVTYGGGSYIAKQNVATGIDITNTTYWLQITEKGNKGDTGSKGDTGDTGNGIASIAKTATSGNVDTYTITYTNGNTTTFTVTNGSVTSVNGATGAVVLDADDIEYETDVSVEDKLSSLSQTKADKDDFVDGNDSYRVQLVLQSDGYIHLVGTQNT